MTKDEYIRKAKWKLENMSENIYTALDYINDYENDERTFDDMRDMVECIVMDIGEDFADLNHLELVSVE